MDLKSIPLGLGQNDYWHRKDLCGMAVPAVHGDFKHCVRACGVVMPHMVSIQSVCERVCGGVWVDGLDGRGWGVFNQWILSPSP